MPHAERTKASTDGEWTAVRAFLRRALQPPAPPVRYLANEGVILEGSRGRVLIDALFGDGLPEYPTVPPASRDSLERAVGQYGGSAVVLVTHTHRDHFDSAAGARYRQHNPATVVVGPSSSVRRRRERRPRRRSISAGSGSDRSRSRTGRGPGLLDMRPTW